MEKKTIYAIGIIAIIAIGGGIVIGIFLLQGGGEGGGGYPADTLVFGTMYLPVDLDPQVSWDSASGDVIDQVTEGLYAYDLSDPQLAIIPRLALADGNWSTDNLNYTVSLRTDVTFHDGQPFNASAVQWNWERMDWCLNTTGTNYDGVTQIEELYDG